MTLITLEIDEGLLKELISATGEEDKSKAVQKALEEYIRKEHLKKILTLEGKLDLNLDDWYEHRHMQR